MIKPVLFFPFLLSLFLCMSCSTKDDLSPNERSDPRFNSSDYVVENNLIAAYLTEYERTHESRSLPVYMAHGYLYSSTIGGSDHAGPIQVGYGDSFTVFADYSGSNYLFGGRHTLKIEWLYGNREFDQEGDGATQYYFNNEQGPVDLYYSYLCDIYTNSQCFWIIFGYFAE